MGRWLRLCGFVVLLCSILSCTSLELRRARTGVDAAVAQLPVLKGFDVIKIENLEDSMSAGGETCYYARAIVVVGSHLPEIEAINVYSEALQSTGHNPRDGRYPKSRMFYRGSNERVLVAVSEPYVGFKNRVDWAEWKATYPTIIFVSVVYILPQRDGC